MITLVPAPSLATAETEERSLGSHRFPPVRTLVMNLVQERWNAAGGVGGWALCGFGVVSAGDGTR
ncbi:MAG: hypothetical protein GY832_05245, partial [Chloroflexi bacterium]|nr:hypothetical protein [Chloroflexota bacterium]